MTKHPNGPFKIGKSLGLTHPVLGIWYEDSIPSSAATVIEGRSKTGVFGCALFLVSRAFMGDTVAFTPQSTMCPGAAAGLGLPPNPEASFPGGREALYRFMANGNGCTPQGRAEAERMRAEGFREAVVKEFLEGEGLKKSYDLVVEYHEKWFPPAEPETGVIVMRPLAASDAERPPKVALMLCDALQLSALVVLANYAQPGVDNVRIPLAAGCSSIAAFPLYEARQERPKAVIGLADVSSRRNMAVTLGREYLAMSIPWRLYSEMEGNATESFLGRPYWKQVMSCPVG
jgi:hypothetical protein